MKKPTPHPILQLPDAARLPADVWVRAMNEREEWIRREKENPLTFGWEPPIWRVCDALLGWEWMDQNYAYNMRTLLGFNAPVDVLLINGGNRGGKSEYAAKRMMQVLYSGRMKRGWCLHSKHPMSVQYQQPIIYRYLMPEHRVTIRDAVAYISYKQKTGFSESSFVLPNGSDCVFMNYEMDMRSVEGGELDLIWPDELVPPEWVETMEMRIATRAGKMVITFTPVQGYSPTVRMFQDGAQVMREATAFALPKDGGEPDIERALVTEQCDEWLRGGTGQPEIPAGRRFEKVPRVMKCRPVFRDGKEEASRAVVFFHSSDNPYGNPANVWKLLEGKSAAHVRERWYGVADKLQSARFPKFSRSVHVVRADSIPERRTNYMIIDPSKARNFFMTWTGQTEDRGYVYREWPGNYPITGMDVAGPWALPDGRKLDGKPGPAQNPFGFGLLDYKFEIARLEGWRDYEEWAKKDVADREERRKAAEQWDEAHGSREQVEQRFIDSRYASAPKESKDQPTTLLEELADIGLYFAPAPGDLITDGIQMINDKLAYNEDEPVSYLNSPWFQISEECTNTIFALEIWTWADGLQGATKDPIDNLRYWLLSDAVYVPAGREGEEDERRNYRR